jgi:hypothetical protein
MVKMHYLRRPPYVPRLWCVIDCDGSPAGFVVYAEAPKQSSKRYGGLTWELARLWISDTLPTNAETWAIARSVRLVRLAPTRPAFLVSYADPSVGHAGTIYRAAGWHPDGHTDDDRPKPRWDYHNAETGKRYSRQMHIPAGAPLVRVPRVSKHRFYLPI